MIIRSSVPPPIAMCFLLSLGRFAPKFIPSFPRDRQPCLEVSFHGVRHLFYLPHGITYVVRIFIMCAQPKEVHHTSRVEPDVELHLGSIVSKPACRLGGIEHAHN